MPSGAMRPSLMTWNGPIDPPRRAVSIAVRDLRQSRGTFLMETIATVGLDLAKSIFQVHAISAAGAVVRRALRRAQLLDFFRKLPSCLVGMEACASAHFWAREIRACGHEVKMIPPIYVK